MPSKSTKPAAKATAKKPVAKPAEKKVEPAVEAPAEVSQGGQRLHVLNEDMTVTTVEDDSPVASEDTKAEEIGAAIASEIKGETSPDFSKLRIEIEGVVVQEAAPAELETEVADSPQFTPGDRFDRDNGKHRVTVVVREGGFTCHPASYAGPSYEAKTEEEILRGMPS